MKTLQEFDVSASSVPPATFDYLASLEWIRAAENVCLIGPAGTGKSHLLVALGFAPLDDTGAQLLFRFVAAAYERRALGVGSHTRSRTGAASCRSTPPQSACSTGCCTTATPSSPTARATGCANPQPRKEPPPHPLISTRGGDLQLATSGDRELAVDRQACRLSRFPCPVRGETHGRLLAPGGQPLEQPLLLQPPHTLADGRLASARVLGQLPLRLADGALAGSSRLSDEALERVLIEAAASTGEGAGGVSETP